MKWIDCQKIHTVIYGVKDSFKYTLIKLFFIVRQINRINSDKKSGMAEKVFSQKDQELQDLKNELDSLRNQQNDFFDKSPYLMYEIDFRGPKFLRVNDALCKRMGYSREELLSKDPMDLLDEESKMIFQKRMEKSLAGEEQPGWIEYTGYTQDGNKVIVELYIQFKHENGKPVGALVTAHDITEIKRVENKLHDSEQAIRLAAQSAGMYTWKLDVVTGEISFSGDVKDIIGFSYTEDDDIFSWIDRYTVPEDAALQKEALKRTMRGGGDLHRVNRTINPETNEIIWLETHATLVHDKDGKPWHVYGIVQNITDLKKAEETVQEEKDKLISLVNSIPDEIWFANLDGRFTLANPSALKEFNMASADKDIEEMAMNLEVYDINGNPRPVDESPALRAIKGDFVRNQEEIIHTPGTGELRYRQVSASPVKNNEGKIIGSVSVVRDVTDYKKAEEKLTNQKKELVNINKALNDVRDNLELKVDERTEELKLANLYTRSLIEASLDPMVTIGPDGKITDVNISTEEVTGFKREELIGADFSDISQILKKLVRAMNMFSKKVLSGIIHW